MANYFHQRGIPFGFNPHSETEDPRREDYDLYTGTPENPLLWESKMDWASALSGNLFIEEKALTNTLAHKIAIGRLFIDVFDTQRLRELYNAKAGPLYTFRHVVGGDQADNRGMLLPYKAIRENSQPLWLAVRQLTHPS